MTDVCVEFHPIIKSWHFSQLCGHWALLQLCGHWAKNEYLWENGNRNAGVNSFNDYIEPISSAQF